MVIATPNVDNMLNTLELIPVISHVRGKVGVLAITLNKHAVFVVTEVGRAEPQGVILLIEIAHLVELGEGAINRRGTSILALRVLDVKRALREPVVKVAIYIVAQLLNALKHAHIAALTELHHALMRISRNPLVTIGRIEVCSLVNDVGAAVGILAQSLCKGILVRVSLRMLISIVCSGSIAVGNKNLHCLLERNTLFGNNLCQLQIARRHRVTKGVHLVTVVVDVVLALNVVACMLHHAAKRIAKCSPTAMTNMHGTHRVCRNKLNLRLLAATNVGASKIHALSTSLAKDSVFSCC